MIRVDFISDISCPWCAIGVSAFVRALERVKGEIDVDLRFHPFELNPTMPPEGQALDQYLVQHVGISVHQLDTANAMLCERGAQVGFRFGHRTHIWNTFSAHQLLHWAGLEGGDDSQLKLKLALMQAYHGENRNPSSHAVLLELVQQVGLDVSRADEVLRSQEFAEAVRNEEQKWQKMGIHSVPAVIVEGEGVLGTRSVEQYEDMLKLMHSAMKEH
ncbi:DsbA family oxidoreductase [Gynuella sunshinyii]|uniref:Putative dithiol-disulfide isomerase involved in polyketide biosynthesis n=1 Tax=Gynuella sunshinyii YC6258 TaxID=1445510 RepID=A0A0C5VPU7_9GAMM|nr:DsbA family oxidoreductase [Gynuella sunshinyii]AJQ92274.1 putative dithiol-disulfide isomerase involved in polyketide biosynthesis [Gynuella sunshinyii YC6258]